jgi:hypothetical protein
LASRNETALIPAHRYDRLEQGVFSAKAASTIGETTLKLMQESGMRTATKAGPVNWLTLAGFADGLSLTVEDPQLQTACMMAGHYGGYRFGLAAPLLGRGPGLIAVTGVTAAAVVPQMLAQGLQDPLHPTPSAPANKRASRRAGIVGGSVGAGMAMTTVLSHPNLLKPAAAIPLVALGAASGYLDGRAAVTNQRREQAISTGLGHVAGYALTATVPGIAAAARTGVTRAGLAGVALVPFVVASLDARHQAQKH